VGEFRVLSIGHCRAGGRGPQRARATMSDRPLGKFVGDADRVDVVNGPYAELATATARPGSPHLVISLGVGCREASAQCVVYRTQVAVADYGT
jgi:hypothetical protein